MARKAILMLCHRIPYPADKGDKIRNLNILRNIQKKADVYLGCFIDSEFDLRYQTELAKEVTELYCIFRSPIIGCIQSIFGIVSGKSITQSWFFDNKMHEWIEQVLPRCDAILFCSTAMIQYKKIKNGSCPQIIDLVDVDSDKWIQYSLSSRWLKRWIFRREARLVYNLEANAGNDFDKIILVSDDEAEYYKKVHPQVVLSKISGLSNGIDSEYFNPAKYSISNKIVPGRVVFTGEMNYKPNIEAVVWFVENVWQEVLKKRPDATFVIVGRNPSPVIQAMNLINNIIVTGRIDDVRPFLAEAALVVAPMLIARGLKNKVLEAMAMSKPLVVTPQALLGLNNLPKSPNLEIKTSPNEFADACIRQLNLRVLNVPAHREYVKNFFSWESRLEPLYEMLQINTNGNNK